MLPVARHRRVLLPILATLAVSGILLNSLRVSFNPESTRWYDGTRAEISSALSKPVLGNWSEHRPETNVISKREQISAEAKQIARNSSDAGIFSEGSMPGNLTERKKSETIVGPPPKVKRYHELKEQISAEAKLTAHNSESAYNLATVITDATSWFTPKKICNDTCCAETVAISLDQDDRQIINTLDGLDLADLRLQMYRSPPHIKFHSSILNEAILPCLQPGTIINLDHHNKILRYFFERVRKNISVPYVLLTTESDANSPFKFADRLAEDDLLLKWYGTNPKVLKEPDPDGKFTPFPLGLSKYVPQDKLLSPYLSLTNYTNPFLDKSRWMSWRREDAGVDDIFVKFGVNPMSKRRQVIVNALCGNRTSSPSGGGGRISCGAGRAQPEDIYAEASRYLFGASPPGAGYDCYRTYELLLLGVIPIVEARRPASDELFRDLPVVQMRNMFDSTPAARGRYLRAVRDYVESEEFRNGTFVGWERLFLRYWRRKILRDAGREKDIITDEGGREYYQAWKYTSTAGALVNEKTVLLCNEKGNCEVS